MTSVRFLQYVVEHFKSEDKWSLDASYGKALESGRFRREEMVCTKTLYNYVDLGLLPIKNIDLPEKLRRNTKTKKARENKKNLGRSIEERPEIVSFRTEFGHWEIDTVIGKKDEGEPCVLTLTERMTRMCIWVKARNHTAEAINEALQKVMSYFAEQKDQVFKTITGDNGSEFAGLSLIEDGKLKVYFTIRILLREGHNECHNRMLRRFIPKGKSISDYSADEICFFATASTACPVRFWVTTLPKSFSTASLTASTPRDLALGCDRHRLRRRAVGSLHSGFAPPSVSQRCSTSICYLFENYCNLLLQFAELLIL